MDAHVKKLHDLREHKINVPTFQRDYSWKPENWKRLWFEVGLSYLERITSPVSQTRPIFIGAIVRQRLPQIKVGERIIDDCFGLIDGQQRLITLAIMAAAARDRCYSPDSADFAQWNDDFLYIRDGEEKVSKLTVQVRDREAFDAVVAPKSTVPASLSTRYSGSLIADAYDYFFDLFGRPTDELLESLTESEGPDATSESDSSPSRGADEDPDGRATVTPRQSENSSSNLHIKILRNILWSSVSFVDVVLDQNEDFGSEIFESLNATGTPLSLVDLFRNGFFLLLPESKDPVFEKYWDPLQNAHRKIASGSEREPLPTLRDFFFDEAIRRFGWTPKDRTYSSMMTDIRARALKAKQDAAEGDRREAYKKSVLDSLTELNRVDQLYRAFLCAGDADRDSREVLRLLGDDAARSLLLLRQLDVSPIRPVVLQILLLADEERRVHGRDVTSLAGRCLALVEALVVRRCAGGVSPQQLRSLLADVPLKMRTRVQNIGVRRAPEVLADLFEVFGEERLPTGSVLRATWERDVYTVSGKARRQLAHMLWEIERNQTEERRASLGALRYGLGAKKWSLEHVMPQGVPQRRIGKVAGRPGRDELDQSLPEAWRTDLMKWGERRPFEFYRRYRHCLANITLALGENNSSYGCSSFEEKKKSYRTYSKLDITLETICREGRWDQVALKKRGHWLVSEVCRRWPLPWDHST